MSKICAGIDIRKDAVDVHIAGIDRQFRNARSNFRAIGKFLKKHSAERVVMEATGRMHRELRLRRPVCAACCFSLSAAYYRLRKTQALNGAPYPLFQI